MGTLQENKRFIYYIPSLIFGILLLISIEYQPFNYYLLPIISFGIIPILELFLKPSTARISAKGGSLYDLLLVIIVLLHLFILWKYMLLVSQFSLTPIESFGLIFSMGILCGVYGINVAHELGHRSKSVHQFMAKILLLSSMYMHFFIEHNRGHHKNIGTPLDPATARKGEGIYSFWLRSIFYSYISAFTLEKERLKRKGLRVWGIKNEFLIFQFIQLMLLVFITLVFGWKACVFFFSSALIGILLLETINYVEHYGLFRKQNEYGIYEKVHPSHSWNSDHPLGRYLLFELSRHSDHHDNSSKEYPTLESRTDAPQLPTGYPGMMLLAMVPPLWKRVMDKRLIRLNAPSDRV